MVRASGLAADAACCRADEGDDDDDDNEEDEEEDNEGIADELGAKRSTSFDTAWDDKTSLPFL